MRKKIAIILASLSMIAALSGCNRQILDLTQSFDKAIISMPDGTIISGEVDSWTDYEDGDQIQIKIDGVTYLVHSMNAILIKE